MMAFLGPAAGVAAAQCGQPFIPKLTLFAEQVDKNPITLFWYAIPGPWPIESITLFAGTTPSTSDLGVFDMGLQASVTATAPTGTRLYVSVAMRQQCGIRTVSNEVTFITGALNPPAPPVLEAPFPYNPVTLGWSLGPGVMPQRYILQVGTSPGASDFFTGDVGMQRRLFGNVPYLQPLFARVVAENAGGSAVSNEVTIYVPLPYTGPPETPHLHPPVIIGSTVELTWSGDAAQYTLLARATPDGPVLLSAPVGNIRALTVPNVARGTYYVSAIAHLPGRLPSPESNQVIVVVP